MSSVTVDVTMLGWERSGNAGWPRRKLFEAVPPGRYKLRLEVESARGEYKVVGRTKVPIRRKTRSNEVEVTVSR